MSTDLVSTYYYRICKTPILSTQEERDLLQILKNEDNSPELRNSARTRLAEGHLRFVFKTARSFAKREPGSFPDLIAAGNEGLTVGIDKYDLDCDVKLLTYAGYWVRQRMFDCLSMYRTVKIPVWRQQLGVKIKKLKEANPHITADQCVALLPEAKEKDIKELFDTQFLSFSLDELIESGAESFTVDPFGEEFEKKLSSEYLLRVVNSLDETCAAVIIESFGLLDGIDKKNQDVADMLGIGVDAVKRLKKQGLEELKTLIDRDAI